MVGTHAEDGLEPALGSATENKPSGDNARPKSIASDLAWSLLLPAPTSGSFQHLVLLGGSPTLARQIVQRGIAHQVSCELPTVRNADAVVRLHQAETDLRSAASCLIPGGVLYGEFRSAFGASAVIPSNIRRTLTRAGLMRTAVYWCKPDFGCTEAYVRLDTPNLVWWYCANLFRASSAKQALLRSALKVLARFGANACSSVLGTFAVTAIRGPGFEARPSVFSSAALPEELCSTDVRLLVLTSRNERAILLPFSATSEKPIAVLKVSNAPHHNVNIESEQRVLAAVRALVDKSIRATIPQPYGRTEWGGLTVGIEQAMAGRLLLAARASRKASVRRSIDDLQRVATWLTDFHRQTETDRLPWGATQYYRSLNSKMAEYHQAFGTSDDERELFFGVQNRSAQLQNLLIPLVWSQGDFHPGNIYLSADAVSVIDWASGGQSLPLLDLLKFIEQWNTHVRRHWSEPVRLRSFVDLFVHPKSADELVRASHQEISNYTEALGIDRGFIPILLVQLWTDLALQHRRTGARGGPAAHSRYARTAAAHVRAMAARSKQFFDFYDHS